MTLKELFPSLKAVWRQGEVVQFCVGLMPDPTQLVSHIYDLWLERNLDIMRSGSVRSVDKDLFKSLYTESRVELPYKPLHNPWLNYCQGSDTQVDIPSRFYWFERLSVDVVCNIDTREEIPQECAVHIEVFYPVVNAPYSVITSVLSACRTISQLSPISDLSVKPRLLWTELRYKKLREKLICLDEIEPDVFNLSRQAVSVQLWNCTLPSPVMNHLLHQVSECSTIRTIRLPRTNLSDVTSLTLSNKTSLTCLNLSDADMSAELWESVCKQLKHLVHLEYLNLMQNRDLGAYSDYITDSIEAWGCDSPLRELNLNDCGDVVSRPLLSAISSNCKQLTELSLSHNTMTGMLSEFTSSQSLERLYLDTVKLNKDDIKHLTHLMGNNKLPLLGSLHLDENKLCDMEGELRELIDACVTHHQGLLRLGLMSNNLSKEFIEKWMRRCKGTKIELCI